MSRTRIYDNLETGYREWWKDGRVIRSEQSILHAGKTSRDAWGKHPDVPHTMNNLDRTLLISLGLSPQSAALVMTEIDTLRLELAECDKTRQNEQAARNALRSMVKMCYRKHVLGDENIGWNQLEDYLLHALCNDMGDEGYQKWVEAAKDNL